MTRVKRIAGLWSGHDCSFCILEDGRPIVHAELERYIREKEPKGDSYKFMRDVVGDVPVDAYTSCYPSNLLERAGSWQQLKSEGVPVNYFSHHECHAANAFYSSNFDSAAILTLDGGGLVSDSGVESATTCWVGHGTSLHHLKTIPTSVLNIGGLWTRVTRYVFKLQNGWPYGHQAGTVMAMAALGDPTKYRDDFRRMLTTDVVQASAKPTGQPVGPYVPGKDPIHPYLDRWSKLAESTQQMYDLAAGLQAATEEVVFDVISTLPKSVRENLCLAGGVALNSVMVGKILDRFEGDVRNVYVPPVPYDGGLSIGSAQLLWHSVMKNPRIKWEENFTPFLGEDHGSAIDLVESDDRLIYRKASDQDVVDLLADGKIISVYHGRSESGRRALGNRSILADPRDPQMKDKINQKVKHRQSFRPFAPSILRSEVSKWFVRDVDSPYMSHVVKFRDEVVHKVPAVVHFDGTGRLQTLVEADNPWYHGFLTSWFEKSGVPILLLTSYNDREPIVETHVHAVECFLKTDIDHLYFVDDKILVSKDTFFNRLMNGAYEALAHVKDISKEEL